MVAIPPWPSSSISRYRPPRTLPISAKPAPRAWPLAAGGGSTGRILPYDAHAAARGDARASAAPLQLEALEVAPEFRLEIGPLEAELDRRLEPAHRRARVVADA